MKYLNALVFISVILSSCTKSLDLIQEKPAALGIRSTENCLSLVSLSKQTSPSGTGTVDLVVGINVYSPNNGLKTMVLEMPPAISQIPIYFIYTQEGFRPNVMGFSQIPTTAFSETDSITVTYYQGRLDQYKYPNFPPQPCNIEKFPL